MNVFELPVHPAAEVFPMLDTDELQELAEDIKANGLIEPVVLGPDPDGAVWLVDGRNRREACRLAGIEPETRMLNGEDQAAFIVSVNLNRRHMTKGQKAMALARIYPEPEKGGRGKNSSISEGFHSGYLSMARTIIQFAPEKMDLVKSGAESLDAAYQAARQRKLEATGDEHRLAVLKEFNPELATKVIEGELTLAGAEAEARERESAEQSNRRASFAEWGRAFPTVESLLSYEAQQERFATLMREHPHEFTLTKDQILSILESMVSRAPALIERLKNED